MSEQGHGARGPSPLLASAQRLRALDQTGLIEPWASRRGTGLSHSFCQYVVAADQPFIVSDATRDPRVSGCQRPRSIGALGSANVPS
jgi:hypothetical protein